MKSKAPDIAAAVFTTLANVAATSSRVEKYNILASACGFASPKGASVFSASHSHTFQRILKDIALYAYNPNWTYRITSPPEFPVTISEDKLPALVAWSSFKNILDDLRLGIAVNKKRQELYNILASADSKTRPWLCAVLDRDIKIGFRQWNKLFPNLLPELKLMLCEEWDGETLDTPHYCEPKLDGLRLLIQIDRDGNCTPLSRGGKPIFNLEKYIIPQLKKLGFRACVLDGEVFAGTFGESASIAKSEKPHPNAKALKFYVFDYIPLNLYRDGKCEYKEKLSHRKSLLRSVLVNAVVRAPNIVLVPYPMVPSPELVYEVTQQYMDQGYEGCVLKERASEYEYGRSSSWKKFKPQQTADLTVYSAVEGKAGTRLEGTMGALLCAGTVYNKGLPYKVKVSVGGGFSNEWREYFWKMHKRNVLDGTVIEVKYQDCTVANLCKTSAVPGAKYSLRFPRFKRLRDDK